MKQNAANVRELSLRIGDLSIRSKNSKNRRDWRTFDGR